MAFIICKDISQPTTSLFPLKKIGFCLQILTLPSKKAGESISLLDTASSYFTSSWIRSLTSHSLVSVSFRLSSNRYSLFSSLALDHLAHNLHLALFCFHCDAACFLPHNLCVPLCSGAWLRVFLNHSFVFCFLGQCILASLERCSLP